MIKKRSFDKKVAICSRLKLIFFNLDFNGTIAWIVAGLPYDLIHGVSNFICGILIVPIINILRKVSRN